MSAYGAIPKRTRSSPLAPTRWTTRTPDLFITTFHLTGELGPSASFADLHAFLHSEFADEIDAGRTYPQETDVPAGKMSYEAFKSYFFAADVVVGILDGGDTKYPNRLEDGERVAYTIEEARGGRDWSECVAGFYYIKPNYPGRSSHICNAGFVVLKGQRGKGYASSLARSYLHYGPRLGYEASVFNLVYVNNIVSVRIWESLNFTKVGIIPRAGRLKAKDGKSEEYVDAWVFYKRFDAVNGGKK